MSGLTRAGSPPRSAMASRSAAKSVSAGTQVVSCISTRSGKYAMTSYVLPRPSSQDLVQPAGIANARHAAVAGEVEAKRVEIVLKPCLHQVVGDCLRPRRKGRLNPGRHLQARMSRVARQK